MTTRFIMLAAYGIPTPEKAMHEWTLVIPFASHPVPGSHRQHRNHGENIEKNQPIHDRAHRAWNRVFGIVRLAGCDRNDFDSHITSQGECKRQPDPFNPNGRKPPLAQPDWTIRAPALDRTPEISIPPIAINSNNRKTLITANQYSNSPKRPTCRLLIATSASRCAANPDPLRHLGKPKPAINGHRGHFRPNRDDLHEPIGRANSEP